MAVVEDRLADDTDEKVLRKRIHRLFNGDGPPVPQSTTPPAFWVGPTEEQKTTSFLGIEELALSDDIEVLAEAQAAERRWLNSPHVHLDGMSPEAMLTGGESTRQRLCAFVGAIEAAVRQGSFS